MKRLIGFGSLFLVIVLTMLLSASCSGKDSTQVTTTTSSAPSTASIASNTEKETAQVPKKTYSAPPAMVIDTKKQYTATLQTVRGDLVLELFASDVPKTVNNFVFLAREGFYDGTIFHRVIADFVVQGGDPTGTGMGGPGYRFADEFTSHKHGTGALSMANSGANTNGSQFFITFAPQPHLDGKHSVFGQLELVKGMDVMLKIKQGDVLQKVIIEEK